MKIDYRNAEGSLYGIASGHAQTIWILADPHYLSPELFDPNSEAFHSILPVNSGKLIEAMPELMEEFIQRALNEHPDVILLPGDLTLNSEQISLLEMEEKLKMLEENGITVLVIPGNHDISCRFASDLNGSAPVPAEQVTEDEFYARMGNFGFRNGYSHAPDSFSYTYAVDDNLWILALDANTGHTPGAVSEQTIEWAETELKYAAEHGIQVISMTHQNLLIQAETMERGFVLRNHDQIQELLTRYHVTLNLSAHAHLQHWVKDGSLHDICTECAAVYPTGFAVLTIPDGHSSWHYRKEQFQQYQDEAKRRMYETADAMIKKTLEGLNLSEEEARIMTVFAEEMCTVSFAGIPSESLAAEMPEGLKLWKDRAGHTFWGKYIVSLL